MATEKLSCGLLTTLVANQIYALPSCKSTLYTDATTPTIQLSNTVAFSANTAVTLTAGAATVAGGFIRCTGGALVSLERD